MLKSLGLKNLNLLNLFLYLSIFTLSLGQFSAIYKTGTANIYLFDIVILLFVLIGLFNFNKHLYIPKITYPFFIFLFLALITSVIKIDNYDLDTYFVGLFYLFRLISYFISSIIIVNMIKNNNVSLDNLINLLLISGLFISVAGFIQLLVLPDLSVLESNLMWDPHKNRLVSVFFDPNFTGAYLSILSSILLYKYFHKNNFDKIDFFLLLTFVISIILTFSRSSWLFLSIVFIIQAIKKSKLFVVLFFILCFLIYFAVPRIQTRISGITDPSDSAYYRVISWNNTLKIIKDNYLFGIGYNNYREVQKQYGLINDDNYLNHSNSGSDSSLLLIFVTTGIVGFIMFLIYFINYVIVSRNTFIISIILGIFANSMFINSWFFPIIMFSVFSLCVNYYLFDK